MSQELTAAAQPWIDPTALSLLSIFGGALLAAVAGLFGSAVQSRREHKKWLREQRYDTFVRASTVAQKFHEVRKRTDDAFAKMQEQVAAGDDGEAGHAEVQKEVARLEEFAAEMIEIAATLELLGPAAVVDALNEVTDAFETKNEEVIRAAEVKFIKAARSVLKIP